MLGQRGWHPGSGHVTLNSTPLVRFLRQQGLYIALSAVVGAIFWAIGQQISEFCNGQFQDDATLLVVAVS